MREHEPLTDKFWQGINDKERANPISQADYEEWRCSPVTNRLYTWLEQQIVAKQAEVIDGTHWTDDVVIGLVRQSAGYATAVTDIFGWSPDGIELEDIE